MTRNYSSFFENNQMLITVKKRVWEAFILVQNVIDSKVSLKFKVP